MAKPSLQDLLIADGVIVSVLFNKVDRKLIEVIRLIDIADMP